MPKIAFGMNSNGGGDMETGGDKDDSYRQSPKKSPRKRGADIVADEYDDEDG